MPLKPNFDPASPASISGCLFTDREPYIEAFERALAELDSDVHRVLMYYGIGGIGKSSLSHKLGEILDEGYEKVYWVRLDFENSAYRISDNALFHLRRELAKHRFRFPTFDICYAAFWEKAHPQIRLAKGEFPFLDEGDLAAEVINTIQEVPGIGLTTKIPRVLHKLGQSVQRWWIERGREALRDLPALEPYKIAERLPGYWALDLKAQLRTTGERVVIMLDTYEALHKGQSQESERLRIDAWVREWIKHLPGILWIITGRERLSWELEDPAWNDALEHHRIGDLAETDARQFLRSCRISDQAVQDAIIQVARGVPYDLNLAVNQYEQIAADRVPKPGDFGRTPHELFELFCKYLNNEELGTLEILAVARAWDRALFTELVQQFGTGFPPQQLPRLLRFSFVSTLDEGVYTLHARMRDALLAHARFADVGAVRRALFTYYAEAISALDPREITDLHRRALSEALYYGEAVLSRSEFDIWFREATEPFWQAAQWRFLIPIYEYRLTSVEQELGADHLETATAINNLARLYQAQARYAEAEPLFRRAFDIQEYALGADHPKVMTLLNNLANLYSDQGRYAEAEPLLRRVVNTRERTLGAEHPDFTTSLNNLAQLYSAQGRLSEAEPLLRRALQVREHLFGSRHASVATPLNNLANLYRAQGRYAEAEPIYHCAIRIKEETFGPDHPDLALVLNNLASLYMDQERYGEAEPILLRTLRIAEKTLGSDHPSVATMLNNLAVLYWTQGRFSEAEAMLLRDLRIGEKVLGPNHPDVATTLNNLAFFYQTWGRYGEAESLLFRALDIREDVLGPEHHSVATTMSNLGLLYQSMGRLNQAKSFYYRALNIFKEALGPDHPNTRVLRDHCASFSEEAL